MHFSFKIMVAMFVAIGASVGISFGLGVAYGHGNAPKAASSCCTAQQFQSLTGLSVANGGNGTANATTGGASGAAGGGASTQGGNGGTAQRATAAANGTTGSISALDGQTMTIQSRTGPIKVNLSPSTKISKLTTGSASDLAVGSSVVISGTRKDDGSYDATEIDQAPADLATLIGGGFAGGASATPAAGR
jgi:hypothetical protein